MNSQKGRAWPLSIIGIFIFLSIMLFGILYISLKYVPVNKENIFQMGYQEVDKTYNEIMEEQEKFNARYAVAFLMPKLSAEPIETMRMNGEKAYFNHAFTLSGENRFELKVTDKQGNGVTDAKIELLLTRYETSEFDQKVAVLPERDGRYTTEPFSVAQEGRWKIVAKVTAGDNTGYFEQSVYAR